MNTIYHTTPGPKNSLEMILALPFFACLFISACGGVQSPPPSRTIDSSSLELKITDLPPAWEVKTNGIDGLVLIPTAADRSGMITVTVGPEEEGINLVAAVDGHRNAIESSDDGTYAGAQELAGPLGTAFYSRGRFTKGAVMTEETRVFSLHPTTSRLLMLEYSYPAAEDSSERVSELIELFSLIE